MIGRKLSQYEIQEELSRGGMGVVYRALDTKLDRDVALKVLPPALVADETRRRRFVQEAKAAAAIHHPHVATIHEIDQYEDVHFIVMELIEGEKLSDLVARGALPVPRALELATEMAEGLSKAHEKNVVHRDLKPANIMVTEDGHAKIIDFGLAKLLDPLRPLGKDGSEAETGLRGETDPGQILGTVSYMSPEQARGEAVDHRSDIFSFGIVLFEMLTGKVPFQGKTGTDTLSAILRDPTPRLSGVEAPLQHVLDRCLSKEPDERYQTAKDLLAELKRLKRDTESGAREPVTAKPRWSPMWLFAPAVVIAAIALLWSRAPDRFVPRVGRTIQITRLPSLELDAAISPNGDFVAYSAGPIGATKIYVQQVAGGRPVALTEEFPGAHGLPRWSPDGTRIAFTRTSGSEPEMFSIPALGGAPRRFGWGGFGLVWSPEGDAVAYVNEDAIFIAPSDGGEPRKVTDAFFPHSLSWSSDGTRIAFTSGNPSFGGAGRMLLNIAPSAIMVVPASGGALMPVTDNSDLNFSPVWMPDGKSLLFVSDRGGARDIYHVEVGSSREPERLTTGLDVFTITLSDDGRKLAYSVTTSRQNLWSIPVPGDAPVSVAEARPLTTGNQAIEGVDISPDGEWLVFDSTRSGNQDIFKMPVGGGEPIQLTTDPAMDCCPTWSPDGTEVAFHSFRTGNRDIFVVSADGGAPEQLTNDPAQERYPDWSPDGREIAFQSTRSGDSEIYVVSRERTELQGETPRQLSFEGGSGTKWSPKGDALAYSNGDSVHVIPSSGGETRVVSSFGTRPLWDREGATIFFRGRENLGIWSVPASGGEPRMVVRFDDPERHAIRPEWSTDSENFYFALTEYESDVWVMELEPSSD